MPYIKAVFTDIDHTLTDPKTHLIPRSAVKAIEQARQNGIKVIAATGRNLTASEGGPIATMEFDGYVTVNGQYCYLPDGTHCVLPPSSVPGSKKVSDWVRNSVFMLPTTSAT
jgi:hydroxymethylpyrimidine pyrophosphatase-like HAD family hydrolase